MPDPAPDRLQLERVLWQQFTCEIAGIDEAGRGPIAGPVVAAALVLPRSWTQSGVPPAYQTLNDSKKLSPRQRQKFHLQIQSDPLLSHAIAIVSPEIIDQINILAATHLAMNQALANLPHPVGFALVDGTRVPSLSVNHQPVVRGDSLSYSIAGASVLAKVTRDRIMEEAEDLHPGYGFANHKGYPTPAHLAALRRLGPCPIHRTTFAPVRDTQINLFP
jgi:ribonuclease HII